ncbi:MAG: histidinol dehydrogenase [Deltaproteobacteria bacterium]|nr:histidinol dehydrogenase [Deltaproteobacteria bacterium]MBF0526090.1 histidinol dehydrogenase [Deltaproteobacteria bacterium]
MAIKPERMSELPPERRQKLMTRSMSDISAIYDQVVGIVRDIEKNGDAVILKHYSKHKSDITPADLVVSPDEVAAAYRDLDPAVIEALKKAKENIVRFHRAQLPKEMWSIEIAPGILAGRMTRPMDSAGCYVPGGRALYPSSVLMTILPAKVAGVKRVIACTPPGPGMTAGAATIVAADLAEADMILKIGGPWAIAAMAFGTEVVPKVDKIVGPGNIYVTAAKMAVFGHVDIDSPAGPSESLIIADAGTNPQFAAIDFLSQVEHDPDAAAILVTDSLKIAQQVCDIIDNELPRLPRREIIERAIEANSAVLVTNSLAESIDVSNEYAPEHLQIMTADPFTVLPRIKHAGSIFLGENAPVPVGDYASGTNHVLPTGQCAKMFSGLSVDDFIKTPTFQYLSKDGLRSLKDTVITLAEAEGLPIHARTIKERF